MRSLGVPSPTAIRRDPRTGVLAAIALGWGLSLGVRLAYPALLPQIRAWFDLDLATAGLLLSVLWVFYAVGQLPGGLLADRLGERSVLAASTTLGGLCLAAVAIAPSLPVMFLATAAVGLTTALYAVPRVTVLSELYPDRLGSAIGVSMAAGDVGNSIIPPLATTIAAVAVWYAGLLVWTPVLIATGVVLWRLVPASEQPDGSGALSGAGLRQLVTELRRGRIRTVWLVIVLIEICWHAFTGFYPTYLVEVKGIASPVAALVFGVFFGLGSLVKIIAGTAYDRVGIRRSLPVVAGIAATGLVALPFVEGLWPVVAITSLASCLLGAFTVTLAYLTAAVADAVQGTSLGVIRTVYIGIGAGSPVAFGFLADLGYFDAGFWILGAIVLSAAALSLRLPGVE